MGVDPLFSLRAAINARDFAPVYVLRGADDFRKDAVVRELIAAAVDPSTRDFNLDVVRGAEATAEALGSLLHTPPMMATRRVVVIRDATGLKKDARETLDRYLANPATDVLLVLVILAGATGDFSLPRSAVAVTVDQLSGDFLDSWIDHTVEALGGRGITRGAKQLLAATMNSSASLASELDKLVSFAAGREIDEAAVRSVVGERDNGNLGEFLDLVAQRESLRALARIDDVLAASKTTLVSVVMALTTQTLALSHGRHARDRGLPPHQLQNLFMRMLKETGAFPMRPWGEAVKTWTKAVSRWDAASLREGLAALRAADQSAKDSRFSSDEQVLATLVCRLCDTVARDAA
jgi:DNA polymerase-3 subunit delta